MPIELLVELGLLILLGFLPRIMFLHEVGCLLRPGEPGLHFSAIPFLIGLLVQLGLLIQVGLLVQVGPRYQKYPTSLPHVLLRVVTILSPLK